MKHMAKYMLDTDTVSYVFRGQGNAAQRFREQRALDVCISAITLAELRFGADKKKSKRIHTMIDAFVHDIAVAPFDADAAVRFGKTISALAEAGASIGEYDALIAAHALALDVTLVTNNERHFGRVPGLALENWL
jgi:tRNA(fMet)-specific endonuclease VapC